MVLSHRLPEDIPRAYCLGFVETLTARAELEAGSQAKMLSDHVGLFADGTA
jgi:hypothetical protein